MAGIIQTSVSQSGDSGRGLHTFSVVLTGGGVWCPVVSTYRRSKLLHDILLLNLDSLSPVAVSCPASQPIPSHLLPTPDDLVPVDLALVYLASLLSLLPAPTALLWGSSILLAPTTQTRCKLQYVHGSCCCADMSLPTLVLVALYQSRVIRNRVERWAVLSLSSGLLVPQSIDYILDLLPHLESRAISHFKSRDFLVYLYH